MDSDKYGWLAALLGFLIAGAREAWGTLRQRRSEVRRDEIKFLQLAVADLEKRHDLCELRCNELREDVMMLLSHIHEITDPPKRKRKAAAQ